MKVGDLVRWHTNSWVFKDAGNRYANPGLIVIDLQRGPGVQPAYQVMWADGQVTNEHVSYLKEVNKDDDSPKA